MREAVIDMGTRCISGNRGQVAMMELLAVIVVVVVLILFGIVQYFKATASGIEHLGDELTEEEASVLIASLVKLPEISCGDGCVDASRLYWLQDHTNAGYYRNLLGKKRLVVEQVYPVVSDELCTRVLVMKTDYPANCGRWMVYDLLGREGKKASTIVSLYYPELHEYRIGRLTVEVGS